MLLSFLLLNYLSWGFHVKTTDRNYISNTQYTDIVNTYT